jgi:hypothetical protein
MKKEKTKIIDSWEELIKFVENINPYKKTLILSGFINEVTTKKVFIKKLIFSTRPAGILKDNGFKS